MAACVRAFLKHLNIVQAFLEQVQDCPTSALDTCSKIRNSLQTMVEATKQEQMKVAFLGNTSNGKSTIINALIKKKVLPVGDGSTTRCFCTITGVPPSQDGSADGYVKTGGLHLQLLVGMHPYTV